MSPRNQEKRCLLMDRKILLRRLGHLCLRLCARSVATVVQEGPGRSLLERKNTAEKLGVLRVGPDVCSLTVEGSDADIREKYREVFTGVGKLKDFQLKLHVRDDVTPVAQPVRRLLLG